MAFRLGDWVICGEIFNTKRYSVHGWIELRDAEQPLSLDLTGDCDDDLKGRHFRFEARPSRPDADGADPDYEKLAWQQVGPTGTMTAARMVKVCDCPVEELLARSKLGEPPPFERKRCLYLEWYSQNGRVVIELPDPIITFVDDEGRETVSTSPSPLPSELDAMEPPGTPGLGVTVIRDDGEGEPEVGHFYLGPEESIDGLASGEPHGPIPDALQQQLDAEARTLDRALGCDDEDADIIREMEIMDDALERNDGLPVGVIFEAPEKLPKPDDLSDAEAETILKTLLAQLALYGIALHVCEHFTPREAYRLLIEKIAKQESFHPELLQTQWVQHFMTSEFCPACDAEVEREYKQRQEEEKEEKEEDRSA